MSKNKRTKYTKHKEESHNNLEDSLGISDSFDLNFLAHKTNRDTGTIFEESENLKDENGPKARKKRKSLIFKGDKIISNNINQASNHHSINDLSNNTDKMLIYNSQKDSCFDKYLDFSVEDKYSSEDVNSNLLDDKIDINKSNINTLNNISIKDNYFGLNDELNLDYNPVYDNSITKKNKLSEPYPGKSKGSLHKNINEIKELFQSEKKNFTSFINEMDDSKNFYPSKIAYGGKKQIDFIKKAIENLKCEDEIFVLNVLCDLSSELSMANDSVAEDPNCHNLIKALIVLLDKFPALPDITMSSINCLNYILDLNPRYTSSVIKFNGIGKIVSLTQNIDYIDCAESAIKAIEKMSYENPFAVVENDAFVAVLALIDFFDLNLRKSALKACVNMTRGITGVDLIKRYMSPAFPSLTILTKFSGNSDLEKSLVDLAVLCFYNIAQCVRVYSASNAFCTSLIQYGLLDNLFQLFLKYLGEDENASNTSNNTGNTANISAETFKNILKLFEILSTLSADVTNLLLNMNILQIVYSILVKDLGLMNKGKKLSSHSTSLYSELFALLTAFFPRKCEVNTPQTHQIYQPNSSSFAIYSNLINVKNNLNKSNEVKQLNCSEKDRLLDPNNVRFFNYFSEKILSLLIDNVVNIPSSNTMVSLANLIEMYIANAPNDCIITYINPKKISNIAGKMVDSKDSSYILQVFNLVDCIMQKVPEKYFVHFIREGVVDNIKNLIEANCCNLYIPQDLKLTDYYKNPFISVQDDMDFAEEEEFLEESLMNIASETNELIGTSEFIATSQSQPKKSFILPQNQISTSPDKVKFTSDETGANPVEDKDKKITKINKDNLLSQDKSLYPNKLKTPTDTSERSASVAALIQQRAKEIYDKFFSDEDIKKLLLNTGVRNHPKDMLQSLIHIKETLKNSDCKIINVDILKKLFNLLFTEEKITFYEIEKSEIILYLFKYFDQHVYETYLEISDCETKPVTPSGKYNKNIISCLKMLFSAVDHDLDKLNEFVKILQHCISSMNCFKLYLFDTGSLKNASHLFLSSYKHSYSKMKMKFVYSENENFDKSLSSAVEFLRNKKYLYLTIDRNDTFETIKGEIFKQVNKINVNNPQRDSDYEEILNGLRHRKGSEEDMQLTEKLLQRLIERKKSMEIVDEESSMNEKEKFNIENNFDITFFIMINKIRMEIVDEWTYTDLIREIKSIFKKSDYLNFTTDMILNFEFKLSKVSDNISGKEIEKDDSKSEIGLILNRRKSSNVNEPVLHDDFLEFLFEKNYKENIVKNKALYSIKRACPFIYLIALLELSVNNFPATFGLESSHTDNHKALGISLQNLENLKVTSLLFKQVKDPYAISSNNVPSWCSSLGRAFPFLAAFNSRYLLFKVSSFDIKRSMTNLYIYLKNFMGENILEDKTLSGQKRQKVKIDRENILKETEILFQDFRSFQGYLEFEYLGETGTGLGPTLEYYSLFSKTLRNMKNIWYKTTDLSLFPAPMENSEFLFELLGWVIARGLYDDRLLDFPLNSLFWDLVLERPVTVEKIKSIDKDLGKALIDLSKILSKKSKLLRENPLRKDLNELLKYNNSKIEDIGLNFILPGYNVELRPGGAEELVTFSNLEDYIELLYEKLLVTGIKPVIDSFRKGFNYVFPIEALKCFTSSELEEVICGCSSESWEMSTLVENVIPSHGYDKHSFVYLNLLEIMSEMNSVEKKQFLLFVTGSPRLPLGGFKSLNPKLTVVKKQSENNCNKSDEMLPTVMTCQNYLKIPDYSSRNILKEKLFKAIEEGGNAFHLS